MIEIRERCCMNTHMVPALQKHNEASCGLGDCSWIIKDAVMYCMDGHVLSLYIYSNRGTSAKTHTKKNAHVTQFGAKGGPCRAAQSRTHA